MLIARSKEPKENKQPTTTGGRQFIKICMYLGKSGKMWEGGRASDEGTCNFVFSELEASKKWKVQAIKLKDIL